MPSTPFDLRIQQINELVSRFDPATQAALASITAIKQYPKGSYLLRQGEISRKSYQLQSGIARKYYTRGQKEITTALYFTDDLALSFNSYIFGQPSNEFIECLTDVTAAVIEKTAFEQAKQSFPPLSQLDFLLTELYAASLEERLFEFHTMEATERYQLLLQKEPHIAQQVQLTHIASYLGISLETLSRIRARRIS
jgi:CRP-like cAMP-binding protein